MNIYEKQFFAECPSDGDTIAYSLEIMSEDTIFVEHINTACALLKKGYQENIAESLFDRFGGKQKITAIHAGVKITTHRE